MELPVTRFTQVHAQGYDVKVRHGLETKIPKGAQPIDMYLAVIPADLLIHKSAVDARTTANPDGYQRQAVPSRERAIARYVTHKGGILPTAVLVNIRDGAQFVPGDDDGRHGTLVIPDHEKFWVEDGQHRKGGLTEAQAKYGFDLSSYEVPVVFTTVPYEEERRIFYVVNHEAKSVPTDLTAELIAEDTVAKIEEGERPSAQAVRQAVGQYIAKRLAQEPGPWYGKIRLAEQGKEVAKAKPVGTSTFGSTLRPTLMDAWVRRTYEGQVPDSKPWRDLYEVVRNYWLALANLMPAASSDVEHFSLQKPLGAYVFNQIMPEFLDLARRAGEFSPKFFQAELERLEVWVTDDQWSIVDGAPEPMVKANNRQVIEHIVKQMKTLLDENPSQHVPDVVLPQGSAPEVSTEL
jgi:DGQHR domain-containing protein